MKGRDWEMAPEGTASQWRRLCSLTASSLPGAVVSPRVCAVINHQSGLHLDATPLTPTQPMNTLTSQAISGRRQSERKGEKTMITKYPSGGFWAYSLQ